MSDIHIKLVKSLAGQNKRRIAVAKSLGLSKMNSSTVQPNNGPTQGKMRKIRDLIVSEEINSEAGSSKIGK